MQEPSEILTPGTRIVVHDQIGAPTGMLVRQDYLAARKGGLRGVLGSFVGGHGGDVYWVKHDDGSVAAYGWHEFELEENPPKTLFDRVLREEP